MFGIMAPPIFGNLSDAMAEVVGLAKRPPLLPGTRLYEHAQRLASAGA